MKTKIALSMLVILFVLAASLGATMAWFTDSEDLTNTFTAGTLEINAEDNWEGYGLEEDWENVNPGDCKDKEFRITNIGSKHSLIRLQFEGEWGEYVAEDWVIMVDQDADLVTVNAPAGWTLHDGWWYYDGILEPDMDASNPFEFVLEVCVDGPGTGNEYQGMSYKFEITVQAIQASNNASGEAWNVDSWYFDTDGVTSMDPTTDDLDLSAENWAKFNY